MKRILAAARAAFWMCGPAMSALITAIVPTGT
jgi:hypothetical protein